jgi:hypothetical protein
VGCGSLLHSTIRGADEVANILADFTGHAVTLVNWTISPGGNIILKSFGFQRPGTGLKVMMGHNRKVGICNEGMKGERTAQMKIKYTRPDQLMDVYLSWMKQNWEVLKRRCRRSHHTLRQPTQ